MTVDGAARPWLVGESNPYQSPGDDPTHEFDLFPAPDGSAGQRLCQVVLGLARGDYIRSFNRRNLLAGKWSVPAARASASAIWRESGDAPLVLLGAKVAKAFGLAFLPFTSIEHGSAAGTRVVAIIPHPSGLSRAWNDAGAYERARAVVLPLLGRG